MIDTPTTSDGVVRWMRAGLLVIAAAGIVGTAVELATIRHWESASQFIPWVVLVLLGVAVLGVAYRPTARRVRAAQAVALVSLGAGLFGVFQHVNENLHAGPLDAKYGPTWSTMSALSKWWAAASGGVGPSPTLAPAVLVQISLCLLLATLAHPAVRRAGHDGPGGAVAAEPSETLDVAVRAEAGR